MFERLWGLLFKRVLILLVLDKSYGYAILLLMCGGCGSDAERSLRREVQARCKILLPPHSSFYKEALCGPKSFTGSLARVRSNVKPCYYVAGLFYLKLCAGVDDVRTILIMG